MKNEGGDDANVHLTVHAMAVTYNSLHQGECQRQMSNVTVSAQNGQQSPDVKISDLTAESDCFLLSCSVSLAHKEVLRFRYDDYAKCVSDHHLIRVKALAEAQGNSLPIMAVADIPLSLPELHIQVSKQSKEQHKGPNTSIYNPNIFGINKIKVKTFCVFSKVLGKAFVWEQLTASISFTNPLPVPLTGGVFTLEGAGLLSDTHIYVEYGINTD